MDTETLRYSERDAEVSSALLGKLTALVEERQAARLLEVRVMLCDVLLGRVMRLDADKRLAEALDMEARGAPVKVVEQLLDGAAHMEWIASITERGQVHWGGRRNRQDMVV